MTLEDVKSRLLWLQVENESTVRQNSSICTCLNDVQRRQRLTSLVIFTCRLLKMSLFCTVFGHGYLWLCYRRLGYLNFHSWLTGANCKQYGFITLENFCTCVHAIHAWLHPRRFASSFVCANIVDIIEFLWRAGKDKLRSRIQILI